MFSSLLKSYSRMPSIFEQFWEFGKKLREHLGNLNFFPSVPPSIDQHELQTQRISSRLFIILFSISLVILLLYTSLIKDTKIVTVKEPTFSEYIHLNSTYSDTLICPCEKVSINYATFLHIEYTLHQVCNSSFVDMTWFMYLKGAYEEGINPEDFRWIGPHGFYALKIFCDLITQTISDGLIQFNSSQYISASIVSQSSFEPEISSLIEQFRSSMTNSFLLSLAVIRDTTQANGLFSALQTNYYMRTGENITIFPVKISQKKYDGCSCGSSSACILPASIENSSSSTSLFHVPNFYKGCYIVESLLQSTLQCFYDQQCIDRMRSYISSTKSVNVTVLDASLPSVYVVNSKIKELVDNLMIEKWNVQSIFERYYNECRPVHCTYSFVKRHDLIYIVTTLFGITGGLTTVLFFIVPRLVKFFRKKKEEEEQQQPATAGE